VADAVFFFLDQRKPALSAAGRLLWGKKLNNKKRDLIIY
jgi:hypothetical protein